MALENARLFDETQRLLKETEQRNSEMAFLNSISAEMAKTLDVKNLTRIVGDKVREIFNSDSSIIMLLDTKTNLINIPYEFDINEGGYIDYVEPFPLGTGLSSKVITTCQPLIANTLEEEIANGAYFPPEIIEKGSGFYSQSWLGVPILSQGKALGLIALSDGQPHKFTESNLHLLQTISSNAAVALENARLFNETQALLKSTEEHAAELSVINSIQQGLAAELDFQAITDLVGDKLRQVLDTREIGIRWFDPKTNLLHFIYEYEHGERIQLPPYTLEKSPIWTKLQDTRRPLILNNQAQQEEFGSNLIAGTDRSQSMVAVPIIGSDRVIGYIILEDYEHENAYNEANVRLLQTVASSMGVALENARLFNETQTLLQETEERASELAVINSVQAGLASKLDMQSIFELIGEKTREVFNVQVVDIVLYDTVTNLISMPYSNEKGDRSVIDTREPFGFRLKVIESRSPLVINQNFKEFAAQNNNPLLSGDWPKSAAFVPLLVGDNVKGIISIQDLDNENAFNDSDVRLLLTLANSMSVALENARLFDETQRLLKETEERNNELSIINSVQQGLAAELDFQAIVDLVGDKLREVLNSKDNSIRWYDQETNLLHFLYTYRHGERVILSPAPPLPKGMFNRLNNTRQPVIWNTVDEREKQNLQLLETDLSKSGIYIPIISSNRILGSISFLNFDRENAYGASERRLISTIAASLGAALENAHLFNETQRLLKETEQRAAELGIINSVQQGLASKLDMQSIYDLVGEKVGEIFSADVTGIMLYDRSQNLVLVPYMVDHGERYFPPVQPPSEFWLELLASNQLPILIHTFEELEQLFEKYGTSLEKENLAGPTLDNSHVYAPLMSGGEISGEITIGKLEPNAFDESDVRLLMTLASSMSVALENARLFDETQRLLKETDQRAAELATINTLSQALASATEIEELITLTGEQMRNTFQADIVYVALLDQQTKTIHFPYQYGEKYPH